MLPVQAGKNVDEVVSQACVDWDGAYPLSGWADWAEKRGRELHESPSVYSGVPAHWMSKLYPGQNATSSARNGEYTNYHLSF